MTNGSEEVAKIQAERNLRRLGLDENFEVVKTKWGWDSFRSKNLAKNQAVFKKSVEHPFSSFEEFESKVVQKMDSEFTKED